MGRVPKILCVLVRLSEKVRKVRVLVVSVTCGKEGDITRG